MTTGETGRNASRVWWVASGTPRDGHPAFHPKRRSSFSLSLRPGKTGGFTLVETLVVLVLVSMMTALMAVSIGQVRKIRAVQQQEFSDMVRRDILRVVKSDLKGALPIPLIDNDGADQAFFLGKPDEIRFVAYVPVGFRAYGVREVRYVLRTGDTKRPVLIRELRRHIHENRNSSGIEREEMNLGGMHVAWFRFLGSNSQTEFSETWRAGRRLPSVVRLDFIDKTKPSQSQQLVILYP